jgi:hypothetical protein
LIRNPLRAILKSFFLLVHLCVIGQVFTRELIKEGMNLMVQTAINLLKNQEGGRTVQALKDTESTLMGDGEGASKKEPVGGK